MELIATWWAAVLAALICAIPAGSLFVVYLLAPIEALPRGGYLLELVGKVAVPIAAPFTAAVLVGPSGDLGTVLVVSAGVTAGLLTFFVAWEPFLHRAGGHRASMLRGTVATVAAWVVSVGVTVLLTSVLLAWIAVPVLLVAARTMLPRSMSSARHWIRSLQVDGREIDCRWVELALSEDGSWLLAWTGPASEHAAGQATFSAEWGDGAFTGSGMLAPLGPDDVPEGWAPPARRAGGLEPQPPETGWKISGRVRDLRFDGHRVRVAP